MRSCDQHVKTLILRAGQRQREETLAEGVSAHRRLPNVAAHFLSIWTRVNTSNALVVGTARGF